MSQLGNGEKIKREDPNIFLLLDDGQSKVIAARLLIAFTMQELAGKRGAAIRDPLHRHLQPFARVAASFVRRFKPNLFPLLDMLPSEANAKLHQVCFRRRIGYPLLEVVT
jgi:hypothetical protein